jgi:RimJ/RimL family protein N-acetyltransferase
LSDEKGSYGTYVIELEEELNPKRIVYTIGETEFGDLVDSWAYITKDNKVQHFDSALPPEGNHQGTYAILGFKLDEEKWGQQVPWDAVEMACKEGEFEFG